MTGSTGKTQAERRERAVILLLCVAGMIRLFLFVAAFPFFNNVDETAHFDLVYRYSRGEIPRSGVDRYSEEVAHIAGIYRTPEFEHKPEKFQNGEFPEPLWTLPNIEHSPRLAAWKARFGEQVNHETGSFPVYYILAGLWCSAGRLLDLPGGTLLYWIRFLNVPLFGLWVWFAYLIGRALFPDRVHLRVGLPILAAVFPQDAFFAISNDALTPLLYTLSFHLLMGVYLGNRSFGYHLLAGLAVAAALLTKVSNFPLLVFAALVVALKARKLVREGEGGPGLPRLAVLAAAVVVPAGLWILRNKLVVGDWSASAEKMAVLGWTHKPFARIWDHPVLTPRGLWTFLNGVTRTFWRGEFTWHETPMASPVADRFYLASSGLLLGASALGLCLGGRAGTKGNGTQRFALLMSFVMVLLSLAFLALLSMLFDYGDCLNPSRERPYFLSGRLLGGAVIPFLILYLHGLGWLFAWLKNPLVPLAITALIALAVAASEISLTAPVFASHYNWFHM